MSPTKKNLIRIIAMLMNVLIIIGTLNISVFAEIFLKDDYSEEMASIQLPFGLPRQIKGTETATGLFMT